MSWLMVVVRTGLLVVVAFIVGVIFGPTGIGAFVWGGVVGFIIADVVRMWVGST